MIHDEVVIGDNTYDFMAGIGNWSDMLKSRFDGQDAQIDAFIAVLQFWRSEEFVAR